MSHLGDRLTALVDGELGHDARERVFAHLTMCAECRAEAETYRNLKARLGRLDEPPPSSDLVGRLLRLAEPGGPMPRPMPGPLPGATGGTRGSMHGGWVPRAGGRERQSRAGSGSIGRPSFGGTSYGGTSYGGAPFGVAALARRRVGVRPRDNRPPTAGRDPAAGSRTGRPSRLRYVLAGVVSAAALALSAGFAAGGQTGGDHRGPRVAPPVDTYAVEHAATVGDVSVTRPQPAGPATTVILTDTGP